MKNKILADTSAWIEFFRSNSETGKKLESLLLESSVFTCGIVLFELLQGVKSAPEKNIALSTLSALPYLEMSPMLWQKSAAMAAQLKSKGVTLPHSDIFIAAIAFEHDLSVFTLDHHFKNIPGLKIYS